MGLTRHKAEILCGRFLKAYSEAQRDGKARWVEQETAERVIGNLLDGLRERRRKDFLDRRTLLVKGRRTIRLDEVKALPVGDQDRKRVMAFLKTFAAAQSNPRFYKVMAVARRVAGTGSLRVDRMVILIEGKGSPDDNYLLDLKEALPTSLGLRLKVCSRRGAPRPSAWVRSSAACRRVRLPFYTPWRWSGDPMCYVACNHPTIAWIFAI